MILKVDVEENKGLTLAVGLSLGSGPAVKASRRVWSGVCNEA